MTGDRTTPMTEPRLVEFLMLDEVGSGPNPDVARAESLTLFRELFHNGKVLRPEDAERALAILVDPDSWHYRLGAKGDGIRRNLLQALLVHAYRVDDPDLVGRLRRYDPLAVHHFDWRHPVPADCLRALIGGVASDPIKIRSAAMRACAARTLSGDVAVVLDDIVDQLWSPATGRRGTRFRLDPAAGAGDALLDYVLRRGDADVVLERIHARAGTEPLPGPALVAVASLLAVTRRTDELTALIVDAATRTAVISGLRRAHGGLAPTIRAAGIPVVEDEPGADALLALADSLARNAEERESVAWMRRNRARRQKELARRARSAGE